MKKLILHLKRYIRVCAKYGMTLNEFESTNTWQIYFWLFLKRRWLGGIKIIFSNSITNLKHRDGSIKIQCRFSQVSTSKWLAFSHHFLSHHRKNSRCYSHDFQLWLNISCRKPSLNCKEYPRCSVQCILVESVE